MIDLDPALLAAVQPGAKLRRTIGDLTPTPRDEIWHVRAVVDDDVVVYRAWNRSRRNWDYHLTNLLFCHLCWQSSTLKETK